MVNNEGHEHCSLDLEKWFVHVLTYIQTGRFRPENIVPTQNYVMMNHDEIQKTCPVAWLVTLALKIDSNLKNGREGRSCARVHAAGCLRDARGYWKMYLEAKSVLEPNTKFPHAHIFDTLTRFE